MIKPLTLATLSLLAVSAMAQAQERYIGEIILTGYSFCPRGTAAADGQLLPISQNTALFSLFGTTFGGDGRTTFALPDLRGRAPVHAGNGPGLAERRMGQAGGTTSVALTQNELPRHTHTAKGTPTATVADANRKSPQGNRPAKTPDAASYSRNTTSTKTMMPGSVRVSVAAAGQGQPLDITNPYLTMRYCVVLQGVYPSRN